VTAEPLGVFEPLRPDHEVAFFACGSPSLDEYLATRALGDGRAHKSRTYVAVEGNRVVGYYSLAAASVEPEHSTARSRAGQGRQPIPAILLARLAVADSRQGRGLGEALLIDALGRCGAAAESIGARVVLVHVADARARAFYVRYGFEAAPARPSTPMLLMKDLLATFSDG
jgi:GNAT superfamily N-acetyltransferase